MGCLKGFLIDLDGVMYTGDTPIPGADTAIRFLEDHGYSYRFISNTTRKSRRTIAARLAGLGLDVAQTHIFTPAVAATAYINAKGITSIRFLVTGDVPADLPPQAGTGICGRADLLIIGDAGDEITYGSLNQVFRDLMEGAELVALERDRYWMAHDGLSLSAGPFVTALEYATGKKALLLGKPSPAFFELALADMGISPHEAAMIGDDIVTDVGGAQRAGMRGVLVRTGKFRAEAVRNSSITPDCIIDSIAQIWQVIDADISRSG